jgi:hypothetical protein
LQQSAVDEVKAVVVADSNTVSVAAPHSAPLIKVQRIEIGGMIFSNVDGYIDTRAPQTATPTTPQGVIGLGLLRSFKVILDYKHQSITFIQSSRSSTESDACTGAKVSFMPEWRGAPVAKAHTEFGDLILVWDTGAARGVIRKQSADNLHAPVTDQIVSVSRLTFGEFDMGAMDFHVIDYAQVPGTDGFIGEDFFANHIVCVDFPGTRLFIRR